MLKPHAHRPELHAMLRQALEAPSLYDGALRLLARRGFPVPAAVLERDVTQPHESNAAVTAIWAGIYARGTGGSAGVAYLRKAIERRFFPELYEARTALV